MRITDKGFNHMLSLGLIRESSTLGIYELYTWDDLMYYCGPQGAFNDTNLNGVYIDLTSEQLKLLPKRKRKTSQEGPISKVLEFFETALVLEFSKENSCFNTTQVIGNHTTLEHLNLKSDTSSPLSIVKNSKKPFHGNYSPLEPFNEKLKSLGVNTANLWITAVPVLKNGDFKGVLMGFSQDVDYGMEVIDVFNECAKGLDLAS